MGTNLFGFLDGKKTVLGAFLAALFPVAAQTAETTGVVPVGSTAAFTSFVQALGQFLVVVGVADKIRKVGAY